MTISLSQHSHTQVLAVGVSIQYPYNTLLTIVCSLYFTRDKIIDNDYRTLNNTSHFRNMMPTYDAGWLFGWLVGWSIVRLFSIVWFSIII